MCSVAASAPSTTLRSLRESRVVPLPRFAGAEEAYAQVAKLNPVPVPAGVR
jgi:hypothetical protein